MYKHIIGLEDNSHYESETTRSTVDIISDQLFSKWIADAESTIEMRVEGLVDEGFSIFDCPECGDSIIGRCRSCREHSTKYSCEKCGYTSM